MQSGTAAVLGTGENSPDQGLTTFLYMTTPRLDELVRSPTNQERQFSSYSSRIWHLELNSYPIRVSVPIDSPFLGS